MAGCLISLLYVAILALIALVVIEAIIRAFAPSLIPPNILALIRLLVGLIVLLYGLQCFFPALGQRFATAGPCAAYAATSGAGGVSRCRHF